MKSNLNKDQSQQVIDLLKYIFPDEIGVHPDELNATSEVFAALVTICKISSMVKRGLTVDYRDACRGIGLPSSKTDAVHECVQDSLDEMIKPVGLKVVKLSQNDARSGAWPSIAMNDVPEQGEIKE